ncbi:MAG: hypothetical protein ACFFFB_14495 [Candidatus Heimdallarchaeota archaeon]
MIEDLLIINESGALLFHWAPDVSKKESQPDLLSGFLTAIDSFASVERGEDIKSLKLRETQIIFEKSYENLQKITFVITTKSEHLIELLHSIIHEVQTRFIEIFKEELNKEFDGEITKFQSFEKEISQIMISHGMDVLAESVERIDSNDILKSIMLIEPRSGSIFFIHAKEYVNKEKISFLIPLLLNSGHLLYQKNLNENLRWILINNVQNENLIVEPRKKIIIVKQFKLAYNFEKEFLSLEFFKEKDKYVKKPQKLSEKFETIKWDLKLKQIFLVDLVGKIFYQKMFDVAYDCSEYIPEAISLLTSSKKVSEDVYNKKLFNAVIGGERIVTICLNFNNFALILIGNVKDFNEFTYIQDTCINIFRQLK